MAEQDWPSPHSHLGSPYAGAAPPPPPAAPSPYSMYLSYSAYPSAPGAPGYSEARRYELRPLSVGEILDRIFSLYRSNFWLFCGLSALAAAVSALLSILRLAYMHFSGVGAASPRFVAINGGLSFVEVSVYLVAYSLTQAATVSAVNSLYLGEPTSLKLALQTAQRLWLRCLGIGLWQGWSATWAFLALMIPFIAAIVIGKAAGALLALLLVLLMFAAGVYGVIAYLRNSLAVPAAVVEDSGVRVSMRRSKDLATGRIGRIFLLILLIYALWMIVGVIEIPIGIVIATSKAAQQFALQGALLAVNFLGTSIVGPIGGIGLCLFYFDERVRREGFDIEMLLKSASVSNPAPALDAAASMFPMQPLDVVAPVEASQPAAEQL